MDILEPAPALRREAARALAAAGVPGDVFSHALHEHDYAGADYDIVWLQWVSLYVPAEALVAWLRATAAALAARGGTLIIKDNISLGADAVYNDEKAGVIRSLAYVRALIHLAGGLDLVAEEPQQPWPKSLFPVHFLVLRPNAAAATGGARVATHASATSVLPLLHEQRSEALWHERSLSDHARHHGGKDEL